MLNENFIMKILVMIDYLCHNTRTTEAINDSIFMSILTSKSLQMIKINTEKKFDLRYKFETAI